MDIRKYYKPAPVPDAAKEQEQKRKLEKELGDQQAAKTARLDPSSSGPVGDTTTNDQANRQLAFVHDPLPAPATGGSLAVEVAAGSQPLSSNRRPTDVSNRRVVRNNTEELAVEQLAELKVYLHTLVELRKTLEDESAGPENNQRQWRMDMQNRKEEMSSLWAKFKHKKQAPPAGDAPAVTAAGDVPPVGNDADEEDGGTASRFSNEELKEILDGEVPIPNKNGAPSAVDLKDFQVHVEQWNANPGFSPAEIEGNRKKIAAFKRKKADAGERLPPGAFIMPLNSQLVKIQVTNEDGTFRYPYLSLVTALHNKLRLKLSDLAEHYGFYQLDISKSGGHKTTIRRLNGDDAEGRFVAYALFARAQQYLAAALYERGASNIAVKVASFLNQSSEGLIAAERPFQLDMKFLTKPEKVVEVVRAVRNVWAKDGKLPSSFDPLMLIEVVSAAFDTVMELMEAAAVGGCARRGGGGAPAPADDPRRVLSLGGRPCVLVDAGSGVLVAHAAKFCKFVNIFVTHGHLDHVRGPDTMHFTKLLSEKKAGLLWSAETASVVADSSNALGLRYLHNVPSNPGYLVEAGGSSELHFYSSGHTPGSLGVIALNSKTGEASLHAGDQRSTFEVCASLDALLEELSQRHYEEGAHFHLKSAVNDDTNYDKLGATVYLQDDSLPLVQALQRVGDPDHADLSRVFVPSDGAENDGDSLAEFSIWQARVPQLYKSCGADREHLKALCSTLGGGEGVAVLAFQTAGFIRRSFDEFVKGTGFDFAKVFPASFSEHSGFDEIVNFIKYLRKYGLEKEGLTLLTSYGSVMEERVDKIWAASSDEAQC